MNLLEIGGRGKRKGVAGLLCQPVETLAPVFFLKLEDLAGTSASSLFENSRGFASNPRTALGSQVYRHGKLSCPVMRYDCARAVMCPSNSVQQPTL
jgi:hypothetical protein